MEPVGADMRRKQRESSNTDLAFEIGARAGDQALADVLLWRTARPGDH